MGRSRCTHKLRDKRVGAGKVVHLQATNHHRFSKQGLGLMSKKRWLAFPSQLLAAWLLLPTTPTCTLIPWPTIHLSISKFERNTAEFKDAFKSFKNALSGTLQPVFNGLYLTLQQTLTVPEKGFSSLRCCTGNMWGFTTKVRIYGQGENSNASTSGLQSKENFLHY